MKTKKVIVGAVSAAMLSLSVCSLAPAVAAGETVQISVGKAEAMAGEQFTVDVSLADVPSTGIMSIDFQIAYDNTIITIDKVEAGAITETGASGSDPTAEAALFDYSVTDAGAITLTWSTGLDSTYYISKDGVFCTITGTVKADAKDGASSKLEILPIDRKTNPDSSEMNDKVVCGYVDNTGAKVLYNVGTNNGSVTVGKGSDIKPTKRGDADVDGNVKINDVVLIMQFVSNNDAFGINGSDPYHMTEQGKVNADVAGGTEDKGGDDVTPKDALRIQEYLAHMITEL